MNNRTSSLIRQFVAVLCLGSFSFCYAQIVEFTQDSVPHGIVSSLTSHESATVVTTLVAPVSSSGYSFTHWEINEGSGPYRVNDGFGRARNPVSFTILNPSTATAHYLPTSADTDADGIPDWYEMHYFGSLTNSAASDGDGDGYSLLTEYQRGYNPLFADGMRDGLLSRSRSVETGFYMDPYFLYRQTSDPGGIYSYSAVVTNGTTINLPALADSGGYRFVWWEVNGQRLADGFGRSLDSAAIVATNGISVVSRHIPILEDIDADGIPDWYELQYFGHLSYSSASDPDGDGYDIATEYARGYLPHMAEEMRDGGLSRSRATESPYYGPAYCPFIINSDPGGIISSYGFVTSGTQVATSVAPSSYSGWRFTHWAINGERKSDAFGVALDHVSGIVTQITYFTAHYMPGLQDSDGDGIPDWYELYFFGHLGESASSDPDGDGYSLSTEYARGYHPVFANSMVDGGLSRSRFTANTVNLQMFERVRHVLLDGVLNAWFTIWPHETLGNAAFGSATTPALGDWDGDGDPDLFVMLTNGALHVWENTGSAYTPDLAVRSDAASALTSQLTGLVNPHITLVDWSGNGLSDLIASGEGGKVRVIASTGHFGAGQSPAVSYELALGEEAGRVLTAVMEVTGDAHPDLLVLREDGFMDVYAHSGDNLRPYETPAWANDFLGMLVPSATGMAVADITRSGETDLLISDTTGRIWEFWRQPSGTLQLMSRVWAGSAPGYADRMTVSAADLDGDGDADAFIGFEQGGMMFLRDPRLGPPSNLRAVGGADSVALTWSPDRQTRVRGYVAYRSTSAEGPFIRLHDGLLDQPFYTDASVTGGQTYFYRVTAATLAYFPGSTVGALRESPMSEVVSAQVGAVRLWMPDYSAGAGQDAVLKINLDRAEGIRGEGLQIAVTYDPAMLTPITVRSTAISASLTYSDNALAATGELVISGLSGQAIGAGSLFDVVFRVNPAAVPLSSSTNTFSAATLASVGGAGLAVNATDIAVFAVTSAYMLGDLNGDGVVDMDDHHHLLWLLQKGTRDPSDLEIRAGDMNGDGELSQRDIPLLLRLIHGKDVNP